LSIRIVPISYWASIKVFAKFPEECSILFKGRQAGKNFAFYPFPDSYNNLGSLKISKTPKHFIMHINQAIARGK
jgi:hypothetical protein